MKTVKDVSDITGISIRTLRYYDEIGLLKPTKLTESGYRLYDNKALEQLQEIMFFRELEIPLMDIKKIMENPNYDKEQVLLAQKSFLERKRNRLNGIIELITDVMKGVNTMSFEAFNNDDIQKMLDHTLETMSKEALDEQVAKYGSKEKYREYLASGFANEQAMADLVKWYGSKEKAMEAILQSTGKADESKPEQDENDKIYKQFMSAKKENNDQLAKEAVVMAEKPSDTKGKVLEMNIDELELSVRSYNCLKRAGINTVEELCNRTSEDMMKVRNLGRKSLEEVLAKLKELGLQLNPGEE